MNAMPARELSSNFRPGDAFLPRRLLREGHSREGNTEGDSVRSSFTQETRGKETSTCPRGGQQVADNGGNERAVPTPCVSN